MELVPYIEKHIEWSKKNFGDSTFETGRSHKGLLEHISRELKEIDENPTDIYEWIDVMILAIDGAWRAGYCSEAIVSALKIKQSENLLRTYPAHDGSGREPIEHIRN